MKKTYIVVIAGLALTVVMPQLIHRDAEVNSQSSNQKNQFDHTQPQSINDNKQLSATNERFRVLAKQLTALIKSQESLKKEFLQRQKIYDDFAKKMDLNSAPEKARSDTDSSFSDLTEKSVQQVYENFENQLVSQDFDDKWSQWADKEISNMFAHQENLNGVQLLNVDCRTSLCKMQLQFDQPHLVSNGIDHLIEAMPWSGDGVVGPDALDPSRVNIYFSREETAQTN